MSHLQKCKHECSTTQEMSFAGLPLTSTDGNNSSRSSDGGVTAWTDGNRGTAKHKAAGLKPKWEIQQVIVNMVETMTCWKHCDPSKGPFFQSNARPAVALCQYFI